MSGRVVDPTKIGWFHDTMVGKGAFCAEATNERGGDPDMVVQRARRVTQEWHNDLLLDAWRDQVEQARRGQEEVGRDLARESADAYEDFLDSLFFYYGESMRAAEKGTKEG